MASGDTRSADSSVSTKRRTDAGQRPVVGRLMQRLLPDLEFGQLVVVTPSGERLGVTGPRPGPHGEMVMHNWRALWRCVAGGDMGFAEGYMAGDWSTPDIVALLHLATLNELPLQRAATAHAPFRLFNRLKHRLRANTKRGSRRNIAAHYDLGNAFYSQWLDSSMTYSSALYENPDASLEDAQAAKIDLAVRLMEIAGREQVLEIGCGWGGVAERLADRHDCSVTGLTLSAEQLAFANERLKRKGLEDRSDFRLQDYRDVTERFDRIVSIEMIEAVGERYWPAFFEKVRECLKPGGIAVIQAITIAESRFDAYRRTPDFIQRYIFPGGMLPTVDILRREIERAGLSLVSRHPFGQSYARTLSEWQQRFQRAWPDIRSGEFGERFKRMWEYYLAYCEVGFRLSAIDVAQYQIRRAD
jgi:cyclopropane-fatty-acyl-phospholipid synthase